MNQLRYFANKKKKEIITFLYDNFNTHNSGSTTQNLQQSKQKHKVVNINILKNLTKTRIQPLNC